MPQSYENCCQREGIVKDGSKRLPICFCIDTSDSMRTNLSKNAVRTGEIVISEGCKKWAVKNGVTALSELQKGLKNFFSQIKGDIIASCAAEISIVTFDDYAKTLVDFCRLDDMPNNIIYSIDTRNGTNMGKGLELSLDKLEECISLYKNYGVEFYPPWLVVMSDGYSTDEYELNLAKQRLELVCENEGLIVIPIGIGNRADMSALSQLAPNRKASKIYGVDFQGLFNQLSNNLCVITNMVDGSDVKPAITAEGKGVDFSDIADLQESQCLHYGVDRIAPLEDVSGFV